MHNVNYFIIVNKRGMVRHPLSKKPIFFCMKEEAREHVDMNELKKHQIVSVAVRFRIVNCFKKREIVADKLPRVGY
jgi:hypothetical protein